ERPEMTFVGAIDVRPRTGRRVHPHASGLLPYRVPDLSLRDAARERLCRLRFRLSPAEFRMRYVRAFAEAGRDVPPAPLLDARDRDGKARLRLDENADIEDAVLLGADELFSVVEENTLGERVLDDALGH